MPNVLPIENFIFDINNQSKLCDVMQENCKLIEKKYLSAYTEGSISPDMLVKIVECVSKIRDLNYQIVRVTQNCISRLNEMSVITD